MTGDKLSAVLTAEQAATWWEYFCQGCSQLRLSASVDKPERCSNCWGRDIEVARPGLLPKCAVTPVGTAHKKAGKT